MQGIQEYSDTRITDTNARLQEYTNTRTHEYKHTRIHKHNITTHTNKYNHKTNTNIRGKINEHKHTNMQEYNTIIQGIHEYNDTRRIDTNTILQENTNARTHEYNHTRIQ